MSLVGHHDRAGSRRKPRDAAWRGGVVRRFDAAGPVDGVELRAPYFDAEGNYHCEGTLARTGVYLYPQPDGTTRRELVRPQELFDPTSLAQLPGLPVTDLHRFGSGPNRMLRDEEVPQHMRGRIDGYRRARAGSVEYLITSMVISDPGLREKARTRQQSDLSPGYLCPLAEVPGRWSDGEHYDAIQGPRAYRGRGWTGHAAVVPVGRCSMDCGGGQSCSCSLRTDAAPEAGGMQMKIKLQGLCAKAHPNDTAAAFKAYAGVAGRLKGHHDAAGEAASESALQALCALAYPSDTAAALKAYADVRAELLAELEGEAEPEMEPIPEPTPIVGAPVATMNSPSAPAQHRGPAVSGELASIRAELAASRKREEAQAARIDALTEAAKAPRHDAMTDEKFQLLDQIRPICGAGYSWAGKSVTQMRMDALEVLHKGLPAQCKSPEELKGKGEVYIAEYFASKLDTHPIALAAKQNAAGEAGQGVGRVDAAGMDPDLARLIATENRLNGIAS